MFTKMKSGEFNNGRSSIDSVNSEPDPKNDVVKKALEDRQQYDLTDTGVLLSPHRFLALKHKYKSYKDGHIPPSNSLSGALAEVEDLSQKGPVLF